MNKGAAFNQGRSIATNTYQANHRHDHIALVTTMMTIGSYGKTLGQDECTPKLFNKHRHTNASDRFPPAIVDIRLQLPTDRCRDAMRQPHVAKQLIVALLVQDELTVAAQTWINFAMAVEVRCELPRAVVIMQVQYGAFADIDEEADILAAPVCLLALAIKRQWIEKKHT